MSVILTGAVLATPAGSLRPGSTLESELQVLVRSDWSARITGGPRDIASTDLAPFVVPLGGVSKVRLFALRVTKGTAKVKVTSASGADQAFPCSGRLVLVNETVGSELTAIKLVGTAEIEYLAVGE